MQEDRAQFMTDLCEEFKIPVPIASCATWVQVAQITYATCEFEVPDLIDALRKAHATPEPRETKQLPRRDSPSKYFENFGRLSLLLVNSNLARCLNHLTEVWFGVARKIVGHAFFISFLYLMVWTLCC
jgi:hypothetical protein